jgi:D-alanyl-lipoteichoic acid acyltransferase DltB (MBOAT superfamily)
VFAVAKSGAHPSLLDAWFGTLSFTFQIYFDFSGYTDMELGLALMFGVRLPLNFDSPYKSRNIIDFWRRWHMTLSRFLREYVYIPLGGNRHGRALRYLNLVLTMLIGGFWHGAAWTFVAWGLLHGVYLAINHAWRGGREQLGWSVGFGAVGRLVGTLVTFTSVAVAWVFFRAEDFASAAVMLKAMTGAGGIGAVDVRWAAIAALLAFVWLLPNSQALLGAWRPAIGEGKPARLPTWLRAVSSRLGLATSGGMFALTRSTGAVTAVILLGVLAYQALRSTALQPFIYFQF